MSGQKLSRAVITLIVLDVLLIVVLVALLITHPGGSVPEADPTQPEATEPADVSDDGDETEPEETDEPSDAAPAPEDALDLSSFAMPSRNIWCELSGDGVVCSIGEFAYNPPDAGDCDGSVGSVVRLDADGAEMPCITEDVPAEAPEDYTSLEYEQATANDAFWCESTERGVTCRSIETGRGFTLSRSGYVTL